jgi:acyl carrier protein
VKRPLLNPARESHSPGQLLARTIPLTNPAEKSRKYPPMDKLKIQEVVRKCVVLLLEEQDIEETPEAEASLFNGGLLDSMAMIRLVSMLERELAITMAPGEVTVDRFDTISGIVVAVQRSADWTGQP